ncbi:MAG: hypothetical protein RIT02_1645 [Planctomycetota bacterium]
MEQSTVAIDGGDPDDVVAQGSVAKLSWSALILQHHVTDGCVFGGGIDGECLPFLLQDAEKSGAGHCGTDGDGHIPCGVIDDAIGSGCGWSGGGVF